MLSFAELQTAVVAARRQFELLKTKHPELRARLPGGQSLAYLVLSLPGGQTGVDSSPLQMLSEFPALIVDDDVKARVLMLRTQTKLPDEEMEQLAGQFYYSEQGQVEMRFNHLDFDLIGKLQVDELVDRQRTPRSKASILIVLGTLGRFAGVEV